MLSIFLIVLFQLKVTLVVNGSQAPATSKEKQSGQLSWTDRSVTIAVHGKVTVYGLIVQVPGMMVDVLFKPLEWVAVLCVASSPGVFQSE